MPEAIMISEDEIELLEQQFGFPFDAEARAVLTCAASADVQACPGAGKTTALVAKLLLLERRLPFPDRSGICVLTHTNVAIDEIRGRVGSASPLFAAPNFCGTIQSFVDRFLAVPALARYHGRRPAYIDSDVYDRRMEREYTARFERFGRRLYPRQSGMPIETERAIWNELRFDFRDGNVVYTRLLGGDLIVGNPDTPMYRAIDAAKKRVIEDGVLHFDDAYYLAKRYLEEFPMLKDVFRRRFGLVFLDEMQDTAPHQIELLDDLFGGGAVIQRFGDTNQRIFAEGTKGDGWVPSAGALSLSSSKRLPALTASMVRHVCHAPHAELAGHHRSAMRPKVILFDDGDIAEVLPAFCHLIRHSGLSDGKHPFKAVGRVGRPNDNTTRHSIQSYYPNFRKDGVAASQPRTLRDFLRPSGVDSAAHYKDAILAAFAKAMYIAQIRTHDGRFFTPHRLERHLARVFPEHYAALSKLLVSWCRDLHRGVDCSSRIESYIRDPLLALFGEGEIFDSDFSEFMEGGVTEAMLPDDSLQPPNLFTWNADGQSPINVELATVHSVKGETHTATLYLETFRHDNDISCILDVIVKKTVPKPNTRPYGFLPLAYVAMTRATDLLCLALHRENGKRAFTQEHIDAITGAGWEVIDLASVQREAVI